VFNVLLQILDDGRLTDGHGRTVDFKNTVVIMTSNLGGHLFADLGPGHEKEINDRIMESLRTQFRPEFLNRVDEVIVFHALSREDIDKIVDIQLSTLGARLASRHIRIEMTPAAKELIVTEGYDPNYGARPLKRTIQRRILDPLAVKVLDGHFSDGDTIMVDASRGEIEFRKAEESVPAA
jgi:ATP-dependent Clp protease ATP-binding subunit ClpB